MMRGLSVRQEPEGSWTLVRVHYTGKWCVVEVLVSDIPDKDTAVFLAQSVSRSLRRDGQDYRYVDPSRLVPDGA